MKNHLRYLAFVLLVGNAFAQSNLPACRVGASSWSNCFGTTNYPNGNKYVGEFKENKYSGQGTYTYANGNKYIGEFKEGVYSGQGTFIGINGYKYSGEWKNDRYNGFGTAIYANGDKYVGEWRDSARNGEGIYTYHNQKPPLVGIWADNLFVRSEKINLPNSFTLFSGQEKEGDLPERFHSDLQPCQGDDASKWNNCFGTFIFSIGNTYVGEWKNGKYNGRGIETFKSGERYVGEFKDDKYSGQGTFTYPNEKPPLEGFWEDNVFVRANVIKQANQVSITSQQINAEQKVQSNLIGKRVALVVGNANYKSRPLRNPLNDANDVSYALKATGFQVIDLRDASLQQMRAGVRQFGDQLINNDVGLVYYSGHGVEVKGRNYFIPVNADIQREDEIADQGLDVSLILEKMNTAGKGVNILIVDACRDDPFGRSFRSSSRGLAQMDAPRGTIIAYATSPGKVAADGDGRNSPYTKNLVKAMQQPNKPIEQVFKEVRRAVQEETKNQQTPWENTSLSGDFYFRVQK